MLQVVRSEWELQTWTFAQTPETVFLQKIKALIPIGTFISEYTQEQRVGFAEAYIEYFTAFRETLSSHVKLILAGERLEVSTVARNIEYYLKRIELIQQVIKNEKIDNEVLRWRNIDIIDHFSDTEENNI